MNLFEKGMILCMSGIAIYAVLITFQIIFNYCYDLNMLSILIFSQVLATVLIFSGLYFLIKKMKKTKKRKK